MHLRHLLPITLLCSILAAPAVADTLVAADANADLITEVGAAGGFDFAHLSALRSVGEIAVSPDGERIAYTLQVPRRPGQDADGPAWSELHVVAVEDGASRAYVHGEVNVSSIAFTPDGRAITYLAKRDDDDGRALWAIPLDGGESRRLLSFEGGIGSYDLAPDGRRVAFLADEAEDKDLKAVRDKGYDQEVFEEGLRGVGLWIAEPAPWDAAPADPQAPAPEPTAPERLAVDGSVVTIAWSPVGDRLAVTTAPSNLIDERMMRSTLRVVDLEGKVLAELAPQGKLDDYKWSPDGEHLAMIGPEDPNDPSPGRLHLIALDGSAPRDLLPALPGHVTDFAWRGVDEIALLMDEGVESVLASVKLLDGARDGKLERRLRSGDGMPFLEHLDLAGNRLALRGESPEHPSELFVLDPGDTAPRRLTESNPWLAGIELARQETVRWTASDGVELEGILIRPLGEPKGPAPLILMVHGGPEAHDSNAWVTNYSRPGQIAAAKGYAVFYPNYRGSTGRGVAFSKLSQGDPAGAEFRDLIEAVDHLIEIGVADSERVGITGGSYGGYATAWCSTFYSSRFRAGAAFVGVTNFASKSLTTDAPVENIEVHTLDNPWDNWQRNLERSPVRWVERSQTPLLIAGGTEDARVHPSQSLQLYRAMKLQGKTVRYVRYPGEAHGNRRAASRDDYTRRLMRWMDHFLLQDNTEPPPWRLDGDASEKPEADDLNDGAE